MLTQANTLSPSDVEFYEREGYLFLKGILPPEVLSASRLILDARARQTIALQHGFIAACPSNPDREDALEDWFKKWHVAVW